MKKLLSTLGRAMTMIAIFSSVRDLVAQPGHYTTQPSKVIRLDPAFDRIVPKDAMKVDMHGNIFGAGPGGIYVFSPEGKHLGTFDFGVPTGNCNWGEDGSTLFITSNTAIYRIRLNTKGATFDAGTN